MKRPDPNSETSARRGEPSRSRPDALRRGALYLLLVLIGFRPLVQETYESGQFLLGDILGESGGASPALTAALDGLVVLAAALWALSVVVGGSVVRNKTRLLAPGAMLVVAGGLSLLAASDKRVAANATLDWLLLPLAAYLLTQLLRRPWQIRLTLCVIIASATTSAVECFYQKYVSFPGTIEIYETQLRDDLWAARGLELDDPQVILFERRLYGRESRGFFAHNNIAGSYLMLCVFAAMGLGQSRLRTDPLPFRRGFGICLLVLSAFIAGAVLLTGSRGAILAGVGGLVLWAMALRAGGFLQAHRRRALFAAWAVIAAATAAVSSYGLTAGSLPGKSLGYRWMYWKAAAAVTADHPLIGVGMGNFGKLYLRYKGIESPEEVHNPHNLLAAALAGWGILGGIGLVWFLIAASRAVTSSARAARSPEKRTPIETDAPHALGQLAILAVGVFALRWVALDASGPAYLIEALLLPLLVWSFAFLAASLDSNVLGQWADDPLPGIRSALGCGLIAFLVHNTITFSLFEPGPATTAFALFGVLLACTPTQRPGPAEGRSGPDSGRWLPVVAVLALVVVWLASALPAIRANRVLAIARNHARAGQISQALADFEQAAAIDPLDPTPTREAAGLLASLATADDAGNDQTRAHLTASLAYLDRAIDRDPEEVGHYRLRARVATALYRKTESPAHAKQAIRAAEKAVKLYPSLPDGYEQLGDVHEALADVTASTLAISAAIAAYEQALRLDDQRPADEIRRFPPRRRDAIREKIDALRRLGAAVVR